MTGSPQPARMDLDDLAQRCRDESHRFFTRSESDDRYCFEIFRRALQLGNEHAWAAIYENYRNLARGWIRQRSGFESANAPIDEMVALSFEKFWHALARKQRFARFESLQALLQYLRTCCFSTVTDELRRQRHDHYLTEIDAAYHLSDGPNPEHAFADSQASAEFWRVVRDLLQDEREETLVMAYFVNGLKPRQIHSRYPEQFPEIQDVYRTKRNVMNRLRRAEALQDFWGRS